MFNAAKYLSAFPAVVLTVWEHEAHVHDRPFKHRDLWLATVAFNTAYSFYWDVEQDWDMPWIVAARRRQTARGAAGQASDTARDLGPFRAWKGTAHIVLKWTC